MAEEPLLAEQPLPHFRYHPDPVATGMLVARTDFACPVCRRSRAYAYVGPYVSAPRSPDQGPRGFSPKLSMVFQHALASAPGWLRWTFIPT